jgi:hypothetical protein
VIARSSIPRAVTAMLLIAATSICFIPEAKAAGPPTVRVALAGDPLPGATVTATATVTINDGSALQSIRWSQVSGAPATFAGTTGETVALTLAARQAFKKQLVHALEVAPIAADKYPSYVPKNEFRGGLQNRFTLAGVSPFSLHHGAKIGLNLEVVTSSGTYNVPATINAKLPWPMSPGLATVAVGTPVLLHGKTQPSYDWTLTRPSGSAAQLLDPTSKNPDFTPDVKGTYKLTVTDAAKGTPVTLTVVAGTWEGVVVGQDANGRPKGDPACLGCHHTGRLAKFGPWANSGHAEVFTQNVNNPQGHYSEACVSCHTVGYDTTAANGGIDDQPDWQAFVQSGLLTHGALGNWTQILSEFPKSARMANIQCENCHGPQNSESHEAGDGTRTTLSSDLCGTCHGEPMRHGRFQQWQLSGHANYQLATDQATNGSCSKCHTGQGFLAWQAKGFSTAPVAITWKREDVHAITCVVCHDPHDVGTTSGGPATNAPMRVKGSTPRLDAGFTAHNVGNAAICMTCHNARRGLRNDSNFSLSDASRAPHQGPQADIVMGENLYFAKTGTRGFHAMIEDSCVTCHMESTPPPAALSYNQGGTNHTFFAASTICAKCHQNITPEAVQHEVETKLEALKHEIEAALMSTMQAQIRAGNRIDLGGVATVSSVDEITHIELTESHGRQAIDVSLANGSHAEHVTMNTVRVVRPAGSPVELYAVADRALPKAAWNYFMVHADKSKGVHNPTFVNSALDVSLYAAKAVTASAGMPSVQGGVAGIGGGLGNGAGAVSCSTPYVYWTEIAGHMPGIAGSQWRTDVIARNLSASPAALKFVLHGAAGDLQGEGTIGPRSLKAFEDVVALLGGNNHVGALEICSDRPLLIAGRVFNQAPDGTFGQNIDGHVADLGYVPGQTVNILGMRQLTGAYRSNLSVTNAGKTEAEVAITLYDSDGTALTTYNLTVPAGKVIQEGEPFRLRAGKPDLGWGFATITVLKGTNIRTMGSMIDMKTNDPTTIVPKQ